MRWLIVEDALRDRKGHWIEYIGTLFRGLQNIGDEVTILCDHNAEDFILTSLNAAPILPDSIWHRMSDGAGLMVRYLRVPVHAINTWYSMWKYFRHIRKVGRMKVPDLIFVPTVLVHHLLGWYLILNSTLLNEGVTVLLFFPNLPLRINTNSEACWNSSPTTRLLAYILERMRPLIETKRVILGVETEAMRRALAKLTGLPVLYLPHPVEQFSEIQRNLVQYPCFATYGAARAEKGSDLFQAAIENHLKESPEGKTCFAIQWIDSFEDPGGRVVRISESLSKSSRVDVVSRFFEEGEYAERLSQTSVMILPYRASSYAVRVSRVVIEAMVNGIPVIATEGTTMWDQVKKFGVGISCVDENVDSLVQAIHRMEESYSKYEAAAQIAKIKAREHFSVSNFRRILSQYVDTDILVLGDSHVVYQDWLDVSPRFFASGVAGQTSEELLKKCSRLEPGSVTSILLWIGQNDILQGGTPETIATNTLKVARLLDCDRINSGHCLSEADPMSLGKVCFYPKIVILGVLPVGRTVLGAGQINERIGMLNKKLRDDCIKEGYLFQECDDVLADGNGFLRENLTADGIHLNQEGYSFLKIKLLNRIIPSLG